LNSRSLEPLILLSGRIWRDVRVARVYDRSSEVQQIIIAGCLCKGDVEMPYE
jgi:alkylation response protein AidB-like acyl-CoA dehydrogenase